MHDAHRAQGPASARADDEVAVFLVIYLTHCDLAAARPEWLPQSLFFTAVLGQVIATDGKDGGRALYFNMYKLRTIFTVYGISGSRF